MASCEMCGKESTSLRSSTVAGSSMNLCGNCSTMGNMKSGSEKKSHNFTRHSREETDLEVPTNYAQIIQQGINNKKLTPHQVARAVNVKESTLSHYLKSQIKPDVVMARKFESFLGIKLVYEVTKAKVNVEDYKVSQEDNSTENKMADLFANLKK